MIRTINALLHAVGLDASSIGLLLLSLSTIAGAKISNPSWVNFQSAGWVSFQSAPTPELLRLLKDARKGDVLLVESIDRLSRMEDPDWRMLKATIDAKGLCIVALDLPTSHLALRVTQGDEFTSRMLGAINNMMIEMMAAIARKDYQQRRERQAQGIAKAKNSGAYKGRPIDADLHKRVRELLAANLGIRATARHAGCSTTTVLKIRDLNRPGFSRHSPGSLRNAFQTLPVTADC